MCQMCVDFTNAAPATKPADDAPTLLEVVQSSIDGVQLVLPPEFMPVPTGHLFA